MPLVPVSQLMSSATRDRYAVGYFESWSFDALQGVIDAAETTRSPVIIGFNGEFLCQPHRRTQERLSWYGALGIAAAHSASVPCSLIFNECSNDAWLREALDAGFNLIMPADPSLSPARYTSWVRVLAGYAHQRGSAIEAEIGILPSGVIEGEKHHHASETDPVAAAQFVTATGIDLLAVSVGNTHIKLEGQDGLNLEKLAAISKRVSVPLVLHGGTGIAAASLTEAIRLGVRKVNYGTYLKQRYLTAFTRALGRDVTNPHELLGLGGEHDLLVAGRQAVRDAVLERIELLGCCGRA